MLIYLLPADPHPRLYHSVNLTDPYERVAFPAGWAAQLNCVHAEDLDPPTTVHMLDKASWLTAVIEQLVFDLVSQTVSCTFISGPTLQWSFAAQNACVEALEGVLTDLVQSQVEARRERVAATPKYEPHPEMFPQPVSVKPGKHKKQRSLLSTLFSGFNKLSLSSGQDNSCASPSPTRSAFSSPSPTRSTFSSPSPTRSTFSSPSPTRSTFSPPSSPSRPSRISWKPTVTFLPLSKKIPLPQPPPCLRSNMLEARARSALVDAFRQFVVSELKTRFQLGPNYVTWVAHNMLRRTEDQMAWLVQEAGGVAPSLMDTAPPRTRSLTASDMSGSTLVSVVEAPFYDDDVDEQSMTDSTSTETDGSSVHTPVDSHAVSPFAPPASSSTDIHLPRQHVPRSPSPAEFSPEDLAEYTALSAQCLRLRQLVSGMDAARAGMLQDERSFLAVLEVKSRRRAWSNRAFMGSATLAGVGLAMPFRSSPLARCEAVTPELLDARMLETTTGEHNLSTLFPVSEEDEEDGVPAQVVTLQAMESGLLQRPPMRSRTHSMHPVHGLDMALAQEADTPRLLAYPTPPPTGVPVSAQQTLPATALLFQPLKKPMLESQTKLDLFDTEHGDDSVAPEFTLSMDLPPPYAKIDGRRTHDGWIGAPGVVR